MKIALPIWNNRISPLFDTACRVLIWSVEGGSSGEWEEHDIRDMIPPMKVRRIKELGADVLICGAVSNPVSYLVESADIKLIPWVSGPVDEVIEAFLTGELDRPRYFMPGCGRKRRGRGGGQPGGRREGFSGMPGQPPGRGGRDTAMRGTAENGRKPAGGRRGQGGAGRGPIREGKKRGSGFGRAGGNGPAKKER